MSKPVEALIGFLRERAAAGQASVYLDEQARELLRQLHKRKAKSVTGKPAQKKKSGTASQAPRVGGGAAAAQEAAPFSARLEIAQGGSAADQIEALKRQAQSWAPARDLGSLRDTMVFSVGNPEADLMLVGEAPGYQEEKKREPFVGPAGQQLDKILKAMGLERSEVYISNIVKFRPAMARQATSNRKPTPEEMASCLPFIRAEVEIVKPKCLVALGGTAGEGLLGLSGSVGAMRGRWHQFGGIPARVTYHPAYLLHGNAGLRDKRHIWEDMLAVMEELGLPISDKQRGYFLPK